MPSFNARSGEIYFEQRGARANPPALLIHGVGCQLVEWPDTLVDALVGAGYRAILFDHRDVGFSYEVKADVPSTEDLFSALSDPSSIQPPYTLGDMANDVIDLLDHLGQSGAHIIGCSMGGMIAQLCAIEHPDRVFTLTSLMSTTSNPALPKPSDDVIAAMAMSLQATNGGDSAVASIHAANTHAGPYYPSSEHGIARFIESAHVRAYRPAGSARQMAAILTAPDRSELLRDLSMPVLAVHGAEDPLIDPCASKNIIDNVLDGHLEIIPKLGHDLSEPILHQLVGMIIQHTKSIEILR
ncbi:MAG: alpha/beta fold hydrolase [Pseudomonadota bacterium]|nr:alpha/beta fold hydrolase [Pseudomonadota bacterium]